MENQNNAKIITKKSATIRFQIASIFGGIGIGEIVIGLINFVLITIVAALLTKVNLVVSFVLILFLIVEAILLIAPTQTGEKIYQRIGISISFLFKTKTFKDIKEVTGFQSFEDNKIIYNNKIGLVYIIEATNLNLATQDERDGPISQLANTFKLLNLNFDILKMEIPFNLEQHKKYLNSLLNKNQDKNIETTIKAKLATLDGIENANHFKTLFMAIFYGPSQQEVEEDLRFIINSNNNVHFKKPSEEEMHYLIGKQTFPNSLLFEPTKIIEAKNHLKINDNFVSFVTIQDFPILVYDLWLQNLMKFQNVDVKIKFQNVSQVKIIKGLTKAIQRAELKEAYNESQKLQNENYLDNFRELLQRVQVGGESIKMISLIFTVFGDTKKEMQDNKKLLLNELEKTNFVANELAYRQLETYKLVWHQDFDVVKEKPSFWQEISCGSIASAWPFMNVALDDPEGMMLGRDDAYEPVFFDQKHRDANRNSSNTLVLGMTGSGKTFSARRQLDYLYVTGAKVYIIDPEREYQDLAKKYGGQIVAVGNSYDSFINPLQISSSNYFEHLSMLEQFFKLLYPDLRTKDLAELQSLFIKGYKLKNIDDSTDLNKKKNTEYPIFSDLFNIQDQLEIHSLKKSVIHAIIQKLAFGSDGYLWNRHTTFNLDHKLMIFDTQDLSSNETQRNAQLFLMLRLIEKAIKENYAENEKLEDKTQKKWIFLAIDEAHLLINERNIMTLEFLNGFVKRIRKYQGGIILISQNVRDFNNDKIKTLSSGIVNNFLYHFVFKLAPSDISDYSELVDSGLQLNEYHKSFLNSAPTGECLINIGNNNRSIVQIGQD